MNDLVDIENRLRKTYRAVADRTRTDVGLPEPDHQRPVLLVADELAPRRRTPGRLAVAAAALAVVGAAAVVAVTIAGGDKKVDVGSGNELHLPDAPLDARFDHSAVWTGTEMIVFGGYRDDDAEPGTTNDLRDGAAYTPATRSWRRIADMPKSIRGGSLAVWTGREIVAIYTGGEFPVPDGTPFGAAYDPATDEWRLIESPDLGVLPHLPGQGQVAWTGDRVLVTGLMATEGGLLDPDQVGAATYDPATGTWEELPDAPAPFTEFGKAVWTGTELVYVGPSRDDGSDPVVLALDPAAKSWRTLPQFPLADRWSALVAWSGREVIVAGGAPAAQGSTTEFRDAAALDPATGRWTQLPDLPADVYATTIGAARGGDVVAGRMVAWGTEDEARRFLLFDPADHTWTWGPARPAVVSGVEAIVSTGTEVIVWGGMGPDRTTVVDTGYEMYIGQ